ncbi:MAG: hypothetical protein WD342_00155 [Verrucomicrobiales bacterium]
MKSFFASLVALCLFLAAAPYCPCAPEHHGGEAPTACCSQSGPSVPADDSCPHCDRMQEVVLGQTGKVLAAPEATGADGLPGLEPSDVPFVAGAAGVLTLAGPADRARAPGRAERMARLCVFLI